MSTSSMLGLPPFMVSLPYMALIIGRKVSQSMTRALSFLGCGFQLLFVVLGEVYVDDEFSSSDELLVDFLPGHGVLMVFYFNPY
jgi:hypothetical protein